MPYRIDARRARVDRLQQLPRRSGLDDGEFLVIRERLGAGRDPRATDSETRLPTGSRHPLPSRIPAGSAPCAHVVSRVI